MIHHVATSCGLVDIASGNREWYPLASPLYSKAVANYHVRTSLMTLLNERIGDI
jgi:hypothetical protein